MLIIAFVLEHLLVVLPIELVFWPFLEFVFVLAAVLVFGLSLELEIKLEIKFVFRLFEQKQQLVFVELVVELVTVLLFDDVV